MYNALEGPELILNLSYPLGADPDTTLERNYTDYELFLLRTRLQDCLQGAQAALRVDLIPKEWNERMHLTVELHAGPDRVQLTPALHQRLSDCLEAITDTACLLLSDKVSFTYQGVCLPAWWLQSLLPTVRIDDPPCYYRQGALYVDFSYTHSYGAKYRRLLTQVLELLVSLYRAGTVRLDPVAQADFILRWGLGLLDQEKPLIQQTQGPRLYQPLWDDVMLAPDPVAFLQDRLAGRPLRLDLGSSSDVVRHLAAKALQDKFDFSFYDQYLLVKVLDYRQASQLLQDLFSGLSAYQGVVALGHRARAGPGDDYLQYEDLVSGPVKSQYLEILTPPQ